MRKKAKRPSGTRERMVRAAADLFHKQGANATSVDEILEKSNTGKSQFFYYFKSKDGIVHAVLQSFYEALKSGSLPVKSEIESWDDLEEWFHSFVEFQKNSKCQKSCPIGTIGGELADGKDLLRQDARLIFDFTRHGLSRFFACMKARGEVRPCADADALADFCISIVQGGLLVGKVKRETAPLQNSVQQALRYIESLKKT